MYKKLLFFSVTLTFYTTAHENTYSFKTLSHYDTPAGEYGLGNVVCSIFLFGGGAWLAHRQLPRLAGQEIDYDAPRFTKVTASFCFAVGMITGVTGALDLTCMIREKLNQRGRINHN